MNDFTDNENSLDSSPNNRPASQTNQDEAPKQPADKPVQPNPDVEGGNGDVSTT